MTVNTAESASYPRLSALESPPKQASAGRRLERLFQTLRYYRWTQMAQRLAHRFRSPVGKLRIPAAEREGQIRDAAREAQRAVVTWRRSFDRDRFPDAAAKLVSGRVTLLNETREWSNQDLTVLDDEDLKLLWRFQFQYHEFLVAAAGESQQATSQALEFMKSWIVQFPRSRPRADQAAWHSYTISRRLPAWCLVLSLDLEPNIDESVYIDSMCEQLAVLSRRLELDVRGNHLLENLRAILHVCCFLDAPWIDSLRRRTLERLRQEVHAQVLPHGEHFELAPMYHCHVAGMFHELAIVSRDIDTQLHTFATDVAARMKEFLAALVHPDGEIPLLSDSCFGESIPSSLLLADADCSQGSPARVDRPAELQSERLGGYWQARSRDNYLLFDVGPVCADSLPAHGHCDLLNFELSLGGRRWIVDSGVFNYESDTMRSYCRGSQAHNVMLPDGRDQCDIWSRFRMGYRARPVFVAHGVDHQTHWCCAAHDGYRRLGIEHTFRWLAVRESDSGFCLFGLDWASDLHRHQWQSLLHFLPSVEVETDGRGMKLRQAEMTAQLAFSSGVRGQRYSGWYCREFGKREENCVISLNLDKPAAAIGWTITTDEAQGILVPELINASPDTMVVQLGDQKFDVSVGKMM